MALTEAQEANQLRLGFDEAGCLRCRSCAEDSDDS